jgi:hypothetical protein
VLTGQAIYRLWIVLSSQGGSLMADYLNMDALAIAIYVITLFICLGLIAYVVWGWRKRMRYTTRKLERYPE